MNDPTWNELPLGVVGSIGRLGCDTVFRLIDTSAKREYEATVEKLTFGDRGPRKLGRGTFAERFPKLRTVILSKKTTDEDLRCYGTVPWTSVTMAECCEVSDAGLQTLVASCPMLESLNLRGCSQLSDAVISCLGPALRCLNLDGCDQITDAGLKILAGSCPMLESLNLRGCSQLTDAAIGCLGPALRCLNLNGCDQITDAGLKFLAGSCPNLESLNLKWCSQLTDAGWRNLTDLLSLTHLDLSFSKACDNLETGEPEESLDVQLDFVEGMKLEYLGLGAFHRLTDANVQFCKRLPLTRLDLGGCERITDAALKCLEGMALEWLDLAGCRVTDEGLQYLQGMPMRYLCMPCCGVTDEGVLEYLQDMPLTFLNLYSCPRVIGRGRQLERGVTRTPRDYILW